MDARRLCWERFSRFKARLPVNQPRLNLGTPQIENRSPLSRITFSQDVFVGANPPENLVEPLIESNRRLPVEVVRPFAVVGEIDRQIAFADGIFDRDAGAVAQFS